MRNFQNIADEIIEVIEKDCDFDEERISNIIEQIEKIKKSNRYKAPELQYMSWNELASVLGNNFNPKCSKWEKEIQLIFNDMRNR